MGISSGKGAMAERERSQLQSELAMVYGYTMVLTGELRVARILVLPPPQIPSRGPIIPSHELGYMPIRSGPPVGWGSFAQAPGPL